MLNAPEAPVFEDVNCSRYSVAPVVASLPDATAIAETPAEDWLIAETMSLTDPDAGSISTWVPVLPTMVKVGVVVESSICAVTSTCAAATELTVKLMLPAAASVVVVAVTLGSELEVVKTFHAFGAASLVACVARAAYEVLSVW